MSIETTLWTTLTSDAGVRALVSSGSPLDHRIYPNFAPDETTVPYITFQLIATNAFNHLNVAPDMERKVFQINCIANSYETAKAIAEACKSAMNATIGYLEGEGDDYFPSTDYHRVRLDFAIIGN